MTTLKTGPKRGRPTVFFHRTTAANARTILAKDFKDGMGTHLTNRVWRGVWLSNVPLDSNEGANGDTLLKVTLTPTHADLARYEWIEDGKPYRDWLVPAKLINSRMPLRIIED
jgi:hypothetical protein